MIGGRSAEIWKPNFAEFARNVERLRNRFSRKILAGRIFQRQRHISRNGVSGKRDVRASNTHSHISAKVVRVGQKVLLRGGPWIGPNHGKKGNTRTISPILFHPLFQGHSTSSKVNSGSRDSAVCHVCVETLTKRCASNSKRIKETKKKQHPGIVVKRPLTFSQQTVNMNLHYSLPRLAGI